MTEFPVAVCLIFKRTIQLSNKLSIFSNLLLTFECICDIINCQLVEITNCTFSFPSVIHHGRFFRILAANRRIDAQIKKYSGEMDNLVETLSRGNLGEAFVQRVNAKITELDQTISELTRERERMQKDALLASDKEMQLDMLAGALSSLKKHLPELSVYEKRTLIRLLVQKIVWDGKDLHIFMDGE